MNQPLSYKILNKSKTLDTLPKEWSQDLSDEIRDRIKTNGRKIVILDDDPTGTQTVHDLPVLTTWSVETLKQELMQPGPGFFILTNSRCMDRRAAIVLAMEIGMNLQTAAELTGIHPGVISRSDSTLRGHFPHEVDEVARAMGDEDLPYLILPFFLEGGRMTINDIHYVAEEDTLVPAAQTPYARDAAFGFESSDLRAWVAEKTGGRIPEDQVISVSLEDIRRGGPGRVYDMLTRVPLNGACIVNAVSYRDVEVVAAALLRAEKNGPKFLYRTAASFVRVFTGILPRTDYLSCKELVSSPDGGGLFVVGSHVPKTTAQVSALIDQARVVPIEIHVDRLLDPATGNQEVEIIAASVDVSLKSGKDTLVYTSRALVTGEDAKSSLNIGKIVSDSLIRIVRSLEHAPRYLVAKGGITSSDVATKALGVKRAMVQGQILPGVPVWKLGEESRYPGMSYIIFPGNVGDNNALADIQSALSSEAVC